MAALETAIPMASITSHPTHHPEKQSIITTDIAVQTPPTTPPQTPRTISELIHLRARQKPHHPILGYPSHGIEYVVYTYAQLDRFANAGAAALAGHLPLRQSSDEGQRVVAILGPSTLDYFITVLALSRLGFTVLFLSTRISEAAYLSLLNATGCSHIVIDSSFQKTVAGVQKQLPELQIHQILSREQYAVDEDVPLETGQRFTLSVESEINSWIIHSSGSTGPPKPIYQTHKAALRNYENSMNMEGFITLPLFHSHGLSCVFRGITACKRIFMYSGSLPMTTMNLLNIMQQHKFEIFYGVPYALKLLSESTEGIEALADMKVVMFGGSACPDSLGDRLAEADVNLISHYGCTETGQLMTSFRPKGDKAWNYVRIHEKLAPFARFEDKGGNLFELVILEGWPSKVATNRDDGSYATKDLFEPHPTIDGAWKFVGRLDDTIVLVNGEKFIPLAIEGIVRQQKVVQDAVVFGSGQAQPGMMIIASEAAAEASETEIVDTVWPVIEKENRNSPGYAQLGREAIVVLPAGTPYPQTDKGTLIRPAFYKVMAEQIEQFYTRYETMSSTGTRVLDFAGTCNFLRDAVLNISPDLTPADVTDNADLFSLGIDSLQSARLRTAIQQQLQLNGRSLSQNFVFDNPTLARMAEAIINTREGRQTESNNVEEEMAQLVSKYDDFPQHVPQPRTSSRNCVIVTGATGSLGAHIVAKLAAGKTDVDEVCCLVRASSTRAARQRVFASLKQRAVLHSLPLASRRKITAYPADFADSRLGLPEDTYERLSHDLKHIIHCAWSVNFNKQLSSFEADCIAGTRNLMLLCLAAKQPSPASLNFCSSVSAVSNTPGESPVAAEALPRSFACAQGMGYAQSKLVTENLCAKAQAATGMTARVLRVGQIVADTVHGIWNDTEAISLMLQAATTIGALPALDESPRWLPVDNVADTVLDISLSSSSTQTFFNVVNPSTFHWTRDLLPALRASGLLSFEQVSQREWISRLKASDPDPVSNPTIKLVEFFAMKYDHDEQQSTKPALSYETSAAEHLSPTLASQPKTGQDITFVSKFISQFLATSWRAQSLSTTNSASTTIPNRNIRLIVVAGPCGTGKSTFASHLADRLQQQPEPKDGSSLVHVIEGDAAHDAISITKMSTSTPLSAIDREIWLSKLRIQVLERIRAADLLQSDPTNPTSVTIILTCSALKREHRDSLRHIFKSVADGQSARTDFVLLEATEDELVRRVMARKGHYMKTSMVRSQLATLEELAVDEPDVVPVDTEQVEMPELVEDVAGMLGL